MSFYYDPIDPRCKSLVGACKRGSEITFRVFQNQSGEGTFSAEVCYFVLYEDGKPETVLPMKRTKEGFELALRFPQTGLFFYYFTFPDNVFLGRGRLRRAAVTRHPASWQITVFEEDYRTPDWMKGGVMYQIFPDRFCKSGEGSVPPHKRLRSDWGGCPSYLPDEYGKIHNNDFFGGNLRGVIEKLDYLESLHVSTVYFNPIFEAYSNHRYDTGDYLRIDPLLGTLKDFDELIEKAACRGIKIVLDGVFNHTGDDSRYFNKYGRYDSLGAYQSPASPYAKWYRFHEFPTSYDSWWGIETLPAVNECDEGFRNFICGEGGVLKYWLARGIGGYRLDVADELPDSFLELLRTSVKEENPDAVIIGEVWEDASNKIAYGERRKYLQGKELDSVMNYPLKDGILNFMLSGSCDQLRETIFMLLDNYPKETLDVLMNVLSTHDTPRILTVLGGKHCRTKREMAETQLTDAEKLLAKERLKAAALLEYTLFGVPCIYYGDEAGMEGYGDPFCRRCFPWDGMDEELVEYFRLLGEIRTQRFHGILTDGGYREVFADVSCLVFERRKDDRAIYVFCNLSSSEYRIRFDGSFTEQLTGKVYENSFTVPPYSYGILAKTE